MAMSGSLSFLPHRLPLTWALLALAAFPALGADAPAAPLRIDGNDLRAGDRTLHVRIASDVDAARARLLRGWLAETARATLTAYGRFPLPDATVRISKNEGTFEFGSATAASTITTSNGSISVRQREKTSG